MKFLYRIVTTDGRKLQIEAESAERALELLDIVKDDCRKWYPMAVKKVLSPEEKAKIQERLIQVKRNPVYREHSKLRKRVKRRVNK